MKPSTIAYMLVFAGLWIANPAFAVERKFALLVGVAEYDEATQLRALPATTNDVVGLREVLVSGGFQETNVRLMTSKEVGRLSPTQANILRSLRDMIDRCEKEDTLVVAFAGHGLQFKGSDERYFCPNDAIYTDKETLIPLRQIYSELGKCKAKRKLLMVDACRNDPLSEIMDRSAAEKKFENGLTATAPQGTDVVAFFSCSEKQTALEDPKLGHGVFFHFVIKGLAGAASNKETGVVTLGGLANYVMENVSEYVKQYKREQTPRLTTNELGIFPLVQLKTTSKASQLVQAAILARQNGENDVALAKFTEAIELEPSNMEAVYQRGVLQTQMGKYEESRRDFSTVLIKKPRDIETLNCRGWAAYNQEDYDAALADFNKALEINSKAYAVLNRRGLTYWGKGDNDSALKDFDAALALNSAYDKAHSNRGALLVAMNKVKEAQDSFDKAAKLDTHNETYRANQVNNLVMQERFEEANKTVERTKQISNYYGPSNDTAQLLERNVNVGQARVFQREGKFDDADRVLNRVEDWATKNPARANLVEIKAERAMIALQQGKLLEAGAHMNAIQAQIPLGMRAEFNQMKTELLRVAREEKAQINRENLERIFGGGAQGQKNGGLFQPKPNQQGGIFQPQPQQGGLFQPQQGGLFQPKPNQGGLFQPQQQPQQGGLFQPKPGGLFQPQPQPQPRPLFQPKMK